MSLNSESDTEELEPNPVFIESYSCFPLVRRNQKNVERGGKLLLPVSALETINILQIPYPLTFKVTNKNNNRFTHAGVVEFVAEEDQVNLPQWMIKSLGLKAGDQVTVESVTLSSATYCRVEPLTRNFAYISDAKTVFEQNLRNFACLTEGDTLFIYERDCNQMYKVRVVETRPETAVNIFDCEMELDLAIPEKVKRSKEQTKPHKDKKNSSQLLTFPGRGYRLDGNPVESVDGSEHEAPQKTKKTLIKFSGEGYSLNGKRRCEENASDEPPNKKKRKEENQSSSPSVLMCLREQQKEFVKLQSKDKEEPFQGQGRSLKES